MVTIQNKLANRSKEAGVEEIDLKETGRVDFKFPTKRSKERKIRVRIDKDHQPTEDFIKDEIDKLSNMY